MLLLVQTRRMKQKSLKIAVAIFTWLLGVLFEDKVKQLAGKIEIKMSKDLQYFIIITLVFAIFISGMLVYWKLKEFFKEFRHMQMQILFTNAILLENTRNNRLEKISGVTINELGLTPAFFEYFGYSEDEILVVFPKYKRG